MLIVAVLLPYVRTHSQNAILHIRNQTDMADMNVTETAVELYSAMLKITVRVMLLVQLVFSDRQGMQNIFL